MNISLDGMVDSMSDEEVRQFTKEILEKLEWKPIETVPFKTVVELYWSSTPETYCHVRGMKDLSNFGIPRFFVRGKIISHGPTHWRNSVYNSFPEYTEQPSVQQQKQSWLGRLFNKQEWSGG